MIWTGFNTLFCSTNVSAAIAFSLRSFKICIPYFKNFVFYQAFVFLFPFPVFDFPFMFTFNSFRNFLVFFFRRMFSSSNFYFIFQFIRFFFFAFCLVFFTYSFIFPDIVIIFIFSSQKICCHFDIFQEFSIFSF